MNLGYWQMIDTILQASLGFVIGVVQCGLIHIGLKRVGQASEDRKSQHKATMRASEAQHDALRELVTPTAK